MSGRCSLPKSSSRLSSASGNADILCLCFILHARLSVPRSLLQIRLFTWSSHKEILLETAMPVEILAS